MNYREVVLRFIDWLTFSFGGDCYKRLHYIREAIIATSDEPITTISPYQSQYEEAFVQILKRIYLSVRGKNQIFEQIILPSLEEALVDEKEIAGIKHAFTTGTRIIK